MIAPTLGRAYVVAGQGELLLVTYEPPTPRREAICGFQGHGPRRDSATWWCYEKEIVREATRADLDARAAQARAKTPRMDCNNPDCWCRSYR